MCVQCSHFLVLFQRIDTLLIATD